MKPVILETTVPASADSGVRTFQVRTEDLNGEPLTAVDVSVCGLENRALHGEEASLLEIHDKVPNNQALAHALIHLGVELLNHPGSILCNSND